MQVKRGDLIKIKKKLHIILNIFLQYWFKELWITKCCKGWGYLNNNIKLSDERYYDIYVTNHYIDWGGITRWIG